MTGSFRLRLALFSALLTGLVVMAFGTGTWWLVRDMRIRELDGDLRAHAEREANKTRSANGWQHIEDKLAAELNARKRGDLLLLVQDRSGAEVYRSIHWPPSLFADGFAWPEPAATRGDGKQRPFREAAGSDRLAGHQAPDFAPPDGFRPGPPLAISTNRAIEGYPWRIGLAVSDRGRIAIAVATGVTDGDMIGIRTALLATLPLALALAGMGAWLLSGRALRPLNRLRDAARRVRAEGLDQRIDGIGEDREFVELIEVFNGMLDRLERSFKQANRFSADAAHELKTPLAILQGQLERIIHSVDDGSATQAELTGVLDEVRRLSVISRKLLLLAQADSGRLNIGREPFDLSKALIDLVEDARMLAPELRIAGEIEANLTLSADGSLLRQVLHNLISNAIKYNQDQGWIRIAAARRAGCVEVLMANASAGIAIADRERIFERFFRGDPARSRQVDGVGLGLAVSREIARAHGGDLTLTSCGQGAVEFTLSLPFPDRKIS